MFPIEKYLLQMTIRSLNKAIIGFYRFGLVLSTFVIYLYICIGFYE